MITKDANRHYWVVSPNVNNNDQTVSDWRQASVKWKVAFMGWQPDDRKHKQIGYKFAHVIKPSDILLIARRHNEVPEVVGCGVVVGEFKKSLKGFKPPHRFGSLRRLSPFKPLSAAPAKLPIIDALGQTAALARLHPHRNSNHRLICDWMERKLGNLAEKASSTGRLDKSEVGIHLKPLRHDGELEYEVRTRQKVFLANKAEAQLIGEYSQWLEAQDRKLEIANYKGLRCDAYEKERGNLIEAKCSSDREYIRMAVGQLLDYSYLGRERFGKPNMAILLPERPDPKSVEWLSELNISVIWKEKDVFLDDANGLFT